MTERIASSVSGTSRLNGSDEDMSRKEKLRRGVGGEIRADRETLYRCCAARIGKSTKGVGSNQKQEILSFRRFPRVRLFLTLANLPPNPKSPCAIIPSDSLLLAISQDQAHP